MKNRKSAKLWVVLLFCLATPLFASAQSSVQGNVINAPTTTEHSANIAAGSDNKTLHSSVSVKNTRMSATVANSVQSKTAVNATAGKGNVASQGSLSLSRGTVKGSVLNSAATRSTSNLAVGNDNQANQSSVAVETSTVEGSLGNASMGKNMVNAAAGSRNQANQSATIVRNSSMSGTLANSSAGYSTVNIAVGTENRAEQGSIRIENSRIRGTATNTSTMQKSANMAAGSSASASQGAIVVGGAQFGGAAVNAAAGANAINAAIGIKSEASQSSIVIDGDQAASGSAAIPPNTFQADSGGTGQGERSALAYPGIKATEETEQWKGARYVPGQVVFLVDNDKAGLAGLDRVAKKYQLDIGDKTVLKALNRILVACSTARDAAETAESLSNESGIHNAQPNYIFTTMGAEDPLSKMQNLVSMLDLPAVHGKLSGKDIAVAVVDTGVEVEHEDLRSRIVGYQNFVSGSAYQGEIHGTAVAGIIGAGKNGLGIVGIAPDVSLLALRACRQVSKVSAMGECLSTSLVRSLDAAISAEVDVVNLSLGAYVNDSLLSRMIDSGYERGIIFAAPVGNDPAAEHIAFPASHEKVVSVAGLDELGNPLPNRRLASLADAVAPATHLFVTTPGSSYNFSDGTSMASASISGIIALSREKRNSRGSPCLPHFNSAVPWPKQVHSCIGFSQGDAPR